MPEVKPAILFGEQGAAYRVRPGKGDEPSQRAYLSKDGKTAEMELINDMLREGGAPLVVDSKGEVQQNLSQRNEFGGLAPPGYGEHPVELYLWKTPVFRIHPISQRLEANNGLFFRLWPEHVKIIQKMKWEGWPHIEIVAVAKELRRRQDEQFQRDEQMAQQHLAMAQAQEEQEAAEIHGFRPEEPPMPPEEGGPPPEEGAPPMGPEAGPPGMPPGPPPGMPPGPPMGMPPGPPMGMPPGPPGAPMAMSIGDGEGEDYFQKLEDARGKFYTRDGFDSGRSIRQEEPKEEKTEDLMKTKHPVEEGNGFGVIVKNTFDFVEEETLGDRKRDRDRSFTTRQSGIMNGPATQDVEDVDDEVGNVLEVTP